MIQDCTNLGVSMKCNQCGWPISPERKLSFCPRCGDSLNTAAAQQRQVEQGWSGRNAVSTQDQWNQAGYPSSGMQQNFSSGRMQASPYPGSRPMQTVKPGKSKIGFMIAAACILLGALLLVVVY